MLVWCWLRRGEGCEQVSLAFSTEIAEAPSLSPGTMGRSITFIVQVSPSLESEEVKKCLQEEAGTRNIFELRTENNPAF